MSVSAELVRSNAVDDEKDIWRKIFFNISSGLAAKTIKTVTGNDEMTHTTGMKSDNPQIDIKRLVHFLHTRDMSSRKVNYRYLMVNQKNFNSKHVI